MIYSIDIYTTWVCNAVSITINSHLRYTEFSHHDLGGPCVYTANQYFFVASLQQ